MRRPLAVLVAVAHAIAPTALRADDDFGTDDEVQQPIVYTLAVTSALGTLVTGVAALVYAVEGDALDTPWLVAALFSGALTMGTGASLLTFEDDASPIIGVGLMVLAAWPLGYSVRSAISPGGFGAPLTSRAPPPPGAQLAIPILTLEL